MLPNWSLVPLPFLNPACISGSSRFMCWNLAWRILSIRQQSVGLQRVRHDCVISLHFMWNECNSVVVWTFLDISLLRDWNENWPFPVLWPLLSFQICWHIECSTLRALSFRIWNGSTGTPSSPLSLFAVMLPRPTWVHTPVRGFEWVLTPSWLSRSLRLL